MHHMVNKNPGPFDLGLWSEVAVQALLDEEKAM